MNIIDVSLRWFKASEETSTTSFTCKKTAAGFGLIFWSRVFKVVVNRNANESSFYTDDKYT